MTPHIQQANTAEPIAASQIAKFAMLETASPSLSGAIAANDNTAGRANTLTKRRRRRARLWAR